MFYFLRFVPPMGQWVNGSHGFVKPRPSRSYHHSSECFPEATHGMSSWNPSGGESHGCYPHRVSMIYWWYIDDIPMFQWQISIRSGEKLQKSTYLDWLLQMSEMEISISRISTAREEKHRHHGESHDCTGPRPPRFVWNSVVKPGFNQHFPHEFVWIVWKITVKTCKNPNLMVNNVYFPHTSLFWRYLLSPYTAEWLMIYELLHNVSHVSWGFFDLDGFVVKPWNH